MNKSESIKNIAIAVHSVQKELEPVMKDATNPYFNSKYATLEAVWFVVGPLLSKNGLSVVQLGGEDSLETVLFHISGEWISGSAKLMPKSNDPQALGSAITYARRYWLSALLGVVSEDDDGNKATHKQSSTNSVYNAPVTTKEVPKTQSTNQPNPNAYKPNLGVRDEDYVVKHKSKFQGVKVSDLDILQLEKDVAYWRGREETEGKGLSGDLKAYIEVCERLLAKNRFVPPSDSWAPVEDDVP